MKTTPYFFIGLAALLLGSPLLFVNTARPQTKTFTFEKNQQGWSADFSDYPVGQEAFFELAWGWENLPEPAEKLTKGLFLAGNNHSDDLFMFAKRRIDGLEPDTGYALMFSILIESQVPAGLVGIGGSPGESVYFKAGASAQEPKKVAQHGFYHLNVDKGNQARGGVNAQVIGDLSNPAVNPNDPHYAPKQLQNERPLHVRSDPEGSIWVFLGTDSGFEGATRFYIAKVTIEFEKTMSRTEH